MNLTNDNSDDSLMIQNAILLMKVTKFEFTKNDFYCTYIPLKKTVKSYTECFIIKSKTKFGLSLL